MTGSQPGPCPQDKALGVKTVPCPYLTPILPHAQLLKPGDTSATVCCHTSLAQSPPTVAKHKARPTCPRTLARPPDGPTLGARRQADPGGPTRGTEGGAPEPPMTGALLQPGLGEGLLTQRPQSPTSRGKAHRTAPRSPLSGTTRRGALQAAGTSADPASVSEPWPGRGVPQTADAPCALQMGFLTVGGCLAQVERGTVTGAAPLPTLPPPRVSVQPGRPRPARLPAAEPAPHLCAVSPRTAAARCLSFLYHVPPAPPRRLPEAGLLPITLPPYCLACSRARHVARPRPNVC